MNLNDYPEKLKAEEQLKLDQLISDMNREIDQLDQHIRDFIKEARNAIDSQNPDEYAMLMLAQKGIKNTTEITEKMGQEKDRLYKYRLLLQSQDAGGTKMETLNVGWHNCIAICDAHVKFFIHAWYSPVCRHYLLDNSSVEHEQIVDGYHTHYTLLAKDEVELRFTRATSARNLFPQIIDDRVLMALRHGNFFSDDFLNEMTACSDKCNLNETERVISDEFLQELLERRSTPEFKDIVFSIQKKQGEIIQAPYGRNMVVQGCAGSGKSMIMLHRLPILLYDNPSSLSRTDLYVITPSQMYIQLAENMRYQLEISDICMGTIEQYYDYCINKYPGCKSQDYGKINYSVEVSPKEERYIFSSQCTADIKEYFSKLCEKRYVSLEKAYSVLSIKDDFQRPEETCSQKLSARLLKLQSIIKANETVLSLYYKKIRDVAVAFSGLSAALQHYKADVLRETEKRIAQSTDAIKKANRELEKLDKKQNVIAVENQKNAIEEENRRIAALTFDRNAVEADKNYFASLLRISEKIESVVAPFSTARKEYSQHTVDDIYGIVDNAAIISRAYSIISMELSRVGDKYIYFSSTLKKNIEKVGKSINALQTVTDKYLDLAYYKAIREENDTLSQINATAISSAYKFMMNKMHCAYDKNGCIQATKYSPYLYLQILFHFRGSPFNRSKESLLAIDEAQSFAPEELRLLKNVNGDKVIMNLYGDVFQHIEGTKGIDDWNEFKPIIDFDKYEMQENYRNASQITNYCNRLLGMSMNAINTPGKGVQEISDDEEFQTAIVNQLTDSQRVGLGAILVGDDKEAKYLMCRFSAYKEKFHDMTTEEFHVHPTRWNIMNVNNANGLEFSSVIVLAGRMSHNQRYIAYTRALDGLYVYLRPVDIDQFHGRELAHTENASENVQHSQGFANPKADKKVSSEVKAFFEEKGIEVIDKRAEGGRLWAIGEREKIRSIVNEAIARFNISGKYMASKESNNKNGWCTKTGK